jgi:hypothetical protein
MFPYGHAQMASTKMQFRGKAKIGKEEKGREKKGKERTGKKRKRKEKKRIEQDRKESHQIEQVPFQGQRAPMRQVLVRSFDRHT